MKTLNYFKIMYVFTISTLLLSCSLFTNETVEPNNTNTTSKSEIQTLYENTFNGKSIFINGDTTIKHSNIQLHNAPSATNIDNLLNKDGSFKMVAIGGGLTAGARDGGLHRNGQLTSFPNLIAIQMKADFKQPLFAENEANGYGYKVLSSMSNGVPKYKAVSNNLAILKTTPVVELNPYNGEIDNWGVPFSGFYDWGLNRYFEPMPARINSNPYKSRLLNVEYGKNNALYQITNKKFDLIIMESGFDNFLDALLQGGAFTSSTATNLSAPNYTKVLDYATSITAKAVMATIPDVTEFPITKLILVDDLRKVIKSEIFVRSTPDSDSPVITVELGSFLLPSSFADSLKNIQIPNSQKRGLSYENPLSYYEVYTLKKIKSHKSVLNAENNYITSIKKYPVVDLFTLFKNISIDNYTTNDGIKANNTNFFSSDGIFPSAFGQAIIANEYIKTINGFYKTNIPLIQTAYYLNK